MCIVIDINVLAAVFDSSVSNHNEFKPVLDWIMRGKGKIVYGGRKYKQELKGASKYFSILSELQRKGKVHIIDDNAVDTEQLRVTSISSHPDFDDPHIVAIFCVSRCMLFCSQDRRSFPYIKNKSFYPVGRKPPKIYRSSRNINLLQNKHYLAACG